LEAVKKINDNFNLVVIILLVLDDDFIGMAANRLD